MSKGIYDIHTHFIPGVDDGSSDMEETRQLLQKEYDEGVRVIFLTSHYRVGMFETPADRIEAGFREVEKLAAEIAPDLKVILGCEFHANLDMAETLKKKERPTMGGTRYVLTEFSEHSEWEYITERISALLSKGFYPIIAHAERYQVLRKDIEKIRKLSNSGAYIQINANSICGIDGFMMKLFCKKLMKEDLIDFVGSDGHNMSDRKPAMGKCNEYIRRVMGDEYADRLLIENPAEIIGVE